MERTAFIKVAGRASFTSSGDFKHVVGELRDRGFDHFVLDLGECVTMDSTFLGVLAGVALRHADNKPQPAAQNGLTLDLLNPNQRVADLLENLGVVHLFKILHQANPCTALFEPVTPNRPAPTQEELSKTCLEAHNRLMEINPANIPKFKDVAAFLAEDLKKAREKPE